MFLVSFAVLDVIPFKIVPVYSCFDSRSSSLTLRPVIHLVMKDSRVVDWYEKKQFWGEDNQTHTAASIKRTQRT